MYCIALYATTSHSNFMMCTLLLQAPIHECGEWTQLGSPMETNYPYFAMASHRSVVAVRQGSLVDVYHFKDGEMSWSRIGNPINPQFTTNSKRDHNYSLELSSDGGILAIADKAYDSYKGRVQVRAINDKGQWDLLGSAINGESFDNHSGQSVALSSNGTTVAIGAPSNNGNGIESGHVRVFSYETTINKWVQRGQNIEGESRGDRSGWTVTISADGSVAAVGAAYNDGNGYRSGHVRIFKLDVDVWIQRGGDLDGEASGDNSGFSVVMSEDGGIVAIGAIYNSGINNNSGHVRIYEYNISEENWRQRGNDIDGEAAVDRSGYSVGISSDGAVVAIGSRDNSGNGKSAGHLRVFKYNTQDNLWIQRGADLDGEAAYDWSGGDVAMSADGTVAASNGYFTDELKIMKWIASSCSPSSMPSNAPSVSFFPTTRRPSRNPSIMPSMQHTPPTTNGTHDRGCGGSFFFFRVFFVFIFASS